MVQSSRRKAWFYRLEVLLSALIIHLSVVTVITSGDASFQINGWCWRVLSVRTKWDHFIGFSWDVVLQMFSSLKKREEVVFDSTLVGDCYLFCKLIKFQDYVMKCQHVCTAKEHHRPRPLKWPEEKYIFFFWLCALVQQWMFEPESDPLQVSQVLTLYT